MYAPTFNADEGRWFVIETCSGEKIGHMSGYETEQEAQQVAAIFDDGYVSPCEEQAAVTNTVQAA